MNKVIKVNNLSYSYNDKPILKDISFDIGKNTFLALVGENGAGKSTIFSLLTRLLTIQSGEIYIDDFPISNYTNALKNMGVVFQELTLDLDLTVKQNLHYYGGIRGISFKQSIESIKEPLENLELVPLLDKKVRHLNGGHRRRVEIARALINNPKLLLFDEASIGLDIKSRKQLVSYVKDLVAKKSISVLWITHLFDELDDDCEILAIKKGEIIYKGSKDKFDERSLF